MVKGKWLFTAYLISFFISPVLIYADSEDAKKVLDKFNTSLTAEDAMSCLTGFMKKQWLFFSKENQEKILRSIQIQSYEAKEVPINDHLEFIVASNIKYVDGKNHEQPNIYQMTKENGQWKIDNEFSGNYIILDLFRGLYQPSQFQTQSSFEFDGQKVLMDSAFAHFKKDKDNKTEVTVQFYPFPLQDRDFDFLKLNFGSTVQETGKATAVASSVKYPYAEMTLYIDENNKVISFCQNGRDFKEGSMPYSACIQDASLIEGFNLTANKITFSAKGSYQMAGNGKNLTWDVKLDVPVLKEGID
jgi:hypothetical protein